MASKLTLKKIKLSNVIQDGIAFDEKTRIINIFQKQKFSSLFPIFSKNKNLLFDC